MSNLMTAIKELRPFHIVPKIDLPDVDGGLLPVDRYGEFIREMQNASVLLKEARLLPMKSFQKDIPRLVMTAVVGPGRDADGKKVAPPESTVDVATNSIIAKELVASVPIDDDVLEDTIETSSFESTVLNLFSEGIGYQLERLFILGDTTSSDSYLKQMDGWMKLAGSDLTESDVDPDTEDYPVSLFKEMFASLEPRFRPLRPKMRIYASYQLIDAYVEYLQDTSSAFGGQYLVGEGQVTYRNIPIVEVPSLGEDEDVHMALLTTPDNLVYGMWRNIRVEPDRDPKMRLTDYIASFRTGCNYEVEDAAVAARISTA